ncbi:MAG: hypothetical protein HBSAPP03_17740 [Phycisphaerae bacterium]|nr:MAG: hypothetical protein HBSAPP03_17740 [Phycisphaerae bacterium]
MKNVIGLVGLAGLAASATAQPPVETELKYEVRIFNAGNNTGWGSSVNANPGDQIEVRAVVSYTGTANLFGLGQIIFQPTVKNWGAGDSLVTSGVGPGSIGPVGSNISTPPGYVADAPGVYGRLTPWAATNYTTSNYIRGHVHNNPDGSGATYLRIARADVTNWFGAGATSGAGAVNNVNGQGGVTIGQGTIGANRPTTQPPQNNSLTNIVVFKFGFILGAGDTRPDLIVSTPANGFGRSTSSATWGQADTRWYNTADATAPGAYRSGESVVDATIHVVPTPASLALMGLGGLMVARRRR